MAKNLTVAIGVKPGGPPPLKRFGEVDKPPMDTEPDPTDPNEAGEGEGGGVNPEWVDYGTSDGSNCKACSHMDDSGNCDVLRMQVGPEDHCKAWEAKEDQMDQPMLGQESMEQSPEPEYPQ